MYKTLNECISLMLRGMQRGYIVGIIFSYETLEVYNIFYTKDGECPLCVLDEMDIELWYPSERMRDENVVRDILLSNYTFN